MPNKESSLSDSLGKVTSAVVDVVKNVSDETERAISDSVKDAGNKVLEVMEAEAIVHHCMTITTSDGKELPQFDEFGNPEYNFERIDDLKPQPSENAIKMALKNILAREFENFPSYSLFDRNYLSYHTRLIKSAKKYGVKPTDIHNIGRKIEEAIDDHDPLIEEDWKNLKAFLRAGGLGIKIEDGKVKISPGAIKANLEELRRYREGLEDRSEAWDELERMYKINEPIQNSL